MEKNHELQGGPRASASQPGTRLPGNQQTPNSCGSTCLKIPRRTTEVSLLCRKEKRQNSRRDTAARKRLLWDSRLQP